MKKFLVTLAILGLLGLAATLWKRSEPPPKDLDAPDEVNVAIVSIVEIPPIVDLREGFRERLADPIVEARYRFTFEEFHAQGDSTLVAQVADEVSLSRPDAAYVLGTPLAAAIQNKSPDLLVVQGAVTDPVSAGLADSWLGSGRQYVATSDLPPIVRILETLNRLIQGQPIGVIYNPSEGNSVAVIERVRTETKRRGISLVEQPVASGGDVATATQRLVGSVGALFVPPDNTVHANLASLGAIADQAKLPWFATTGSALQEGAFGAVETSFRELGWEAANLLLAVLAKNDASTMPIRHLEDADIVLEADRLEFFGLDARRLGDVSDVRLINASD